MKKKNGIGIAMFLALMFVFLNFISMPVWAGPGDVTINGTNFPDANFRSYVSTELDTDGNGILSQAELDAVTDINVYQKNITSLKGIEHFTKLETLICQKNKLTGLDISQNSELGYLDCTFNQLTALDVSQNLKLNRLDCDDNQLTALDVTNNTALIEFYCINNKLTDLDVTKNTKLERLECGKNQFTTLDVSKNTALKTLGCGENQLTDLDVTNNTALKTLFCDENQLTTLDVTNNTALEMLSCVDSQLTTLDVSKNSKLEYLSCRNNQLTVLDLSQNTALTNLYCQKNKLTSLDISLNPKIKYFEGKDQIYDIEVDGSALTFDLTTLPGSFNSSKASDWVGGTVSETTLTLDASKPDKVTYTYDAGNGNNLSVTLNVTYTGVPTPGSGIAINDTNFPDDNFRNYVKKFDKDSDSKLSQSELDAVTEIDVYNKNIADLKGIEHFTKLEKLSCQENKLTALDVTKNTALTKLYCGKNKLTTLDLSNNPALKVLSCYNNQLATLDMKNNPELEDISCFNNQLTALDVTNNMALKKLSCTNNQLTALDMSNNTALKKLVCADNKLTALDVTKNTELKEFYCQSNQLTTLDVSQNPKLKKLVCSRNKLTSLDLTNNTNIVAFSGKDQKYAIEVDENTMTYNLGSLPGHFNSSKASGWTGGSLSGTTLTLDASKPDNVTYTYDAGNGKNLSVTLNVTYTVVPTPTKYTLSFDNNGGSGTMAAVTVNKGSAYSLPACTFTPPAGKEFKAWQVGSKEKKVGDSIIVNGDTTVKAVWKDIGSNPPFPPFPPTPPTPPRPPRPYNPYPWTYPGYWHNEVESPKAKEDKKLSNVEIDWKLELSIGIPLLERKINGVESNIKMDIAPYIKDGRTMLPVRFVAEALGFDVEWIRSTRTVVLSQGKTRVEIPVDTNQIIVNGEVYTSDVKPEIKNNRTMLPIANIARALGLQDGKDIIWDSYSRTVTIYRSILVK